MAWYSAGTISVANGSATVTGANTDFVSNVFPGDALNGPDGRNYEIARVVSATELVLAKAYAGANGGGQTFGIQPTQDYSRTLALRAGALVNDFSAVLDGIGQGLVGDGTVTTPGVRFQADQDTGFYRPAANTIGVAVNGTGLASFRPGVFGVSGNIEVSSTEFPIIALARAGVGVWYLGGYQAGGNDWNLRLNSLPPALTVTPGGLVLIGTTNAATHVIQNDAQPGGGPIVQFRQGGAVTAAAVYVVDFNGVEAASATNAAMKLGKAGTNRSLNASGTINASGADYAEYMVKAAGCGTIAPGDVCGVDVDGRLTRTWADALSFVVKSTDPAYVGGDTWAAAMAPRPEQPGAEPTEPASPPTRPADDAELDAWREIVDAYPAALAIWRADHAAWEAATAAYGRDLAAWEAELEAERVKVDRIAFCGQVPVNVAGEFAVGDYLIAAPAGAGIKAVAIGEAVITFEQYRRRLGKVWAVRDGRAWIDVQHG